MKSDNAMKEIGKRRKSEKVGNRKSRKSEKQENKKMQKI